MDATTPSERNVTERRLTCSAAEAAEMLGVSRALVYQMVTTGEIPAIRIRRRVLILRSQLLDQFATSDHNPEKAGPQ